MRFYFFPLQFEIIQQKCKVLLQNVLVVFDGHLIKPNSSLIKLRCDVMFEKNR